MIVPFDALSDNSRIWIYQADRTINEIEKQIIHDSTTAFMEEWAAHGAPLKCAFQIFHDRFLVVAVDETFNAVSGCSIDSSVKMIKDLEQELQLSFFDRTKIAFVLNDDIYMESLGNLKSRVAAGEIQQETLTFNNMISNKKELESSWIVPVSSTWINKYF